MPTPHTLPITRFSTITLRPVIWWGKQRESLVNNKSIVSEACKVFEDPTMVEIVKKSFIAWIKKQADGLDTQPPRVPLTNGSLVQLTLDGVANTTLDITVHFDLSGDVVSPPGNESNDASSINLCI